MIKETIHCDECGEQKKDANHWFVAGISDLGVTFDTFESAKNDPELLKVLFLYCGQSCLTKVFQRWMNTGKLEKQDVAVSEDVAELALAD